MARSSDAAFPLSLVRDKTFQLRQVRRVLLLAGFFIVQSTLLLGVFWHNLLGDMVAGNAPLLFASEDLRLLAERIPSTGTVMGEWLVAMLAVNAVVTGTLCLWILRRLGNPILAIRRALNEIGDGNLDVRLRTGDAHEFNELTVALNRAARGGAVSHRRGARAHARARRAGGSAPPGRHRRAHRARRMPRRAELVRYPGGELRRGRRAARSSLRRRACGLTRRSARRRGASRAGWRVRGASSRGEPEQAVRAHGGGWWRRRCSRSARVPSSRPSPRRLDERAADANYAQALALVETGRHGEALESLRRLQRRFPAFERMPAVADARRRAAGGGYGGPGARAVPRGARASRRG